MTATQAADSTRTPAQALATKCASPSRRMAVQRLCTLIAAQATGALLVAGCGGGDNAAPEPVPTPPQPPDPAPSPVRLNRLKTALLRAPLTVATSLVEVTQGAPRSVTSSLGASAVFYPTLANPQRETLQTIPQVWGYRRDRWELDGGKPGASGGYATYPVGLPYRAAATLTSNGVCGLHFVFDGSAFEILFAGERVSVTLVVDGQYMAPGIIRAALSGGVVGAPLSEHDALVRFDFGTAANRHVSVYATATRGPCAIVTGPNDHLQAWDRSAEPSVAVMADSYGGGAGPHWLGGPFWEAAALLGIPHLDLDTAGGTGYSRNGANEDSANAGNTFYARLPSVVDANSDLFITAGGINDNNAFALWPFATAGDALASFNAGVADYYRELRRSLPDAVLASVGPWAPNAAHPTFMMARSKAETIKAALQSVGGHWVFIDNLDGSWVNSAGASAPPSGPWQTGTGTSAAPNGTGNGDLYMSHDGVHPNQAGLGYLGSRIATDLRAALLAM